MKKYLTHALAILLGIVIGGLGATLIWRAQVERENVERLVTQLTYHVELLKATKERPLISVQEWIINLADGYVEELIVFEKVSPSESAAKVRKISLREYGLIRKELQPIWERIPSYISNDEKVEYLKNRHRIQQYLDSYAQIK